MISSFNALRKFAVEVISYIKEVFGRDAIIPELRDVFDKMLVTDEELAIHNRESNLSRESLKALGEAKRLVFGDDILERENSKRAKRMEQREVVAIHKADDGVTVKRLKKMGKRWCGVSDNPNYDIIEIEEGDKSSV